MPQDVAQYTELFLSEAKQHLLAMNQALLKLEKSPGKTERLDDLLRALHTLKGMAATMDYDHTARLCHAMEDVVDAIRKHTLQVAACVDVLFECLDAVEATLKALRQNRAELETTALIGKLRALATREAEHGTGDKGRGSKDEETDSPSSVVEKMHRIEVKVERLDALMNLTEEFVMTKMRLDRAKERLKDPELEAAVESLGRFVSELQYQVMQARLVPVRFLFNRFPRMVRDLAKAQHKDVDLQMEGEALELDRAVIDEIGESLVHLLRNAVDHGIETPEERRRAGKPSCGTIRLIATQTKEFAVIRVVDDGAGLDVEAIKAMALKGGLLKTGATKEEVTEAIFAGLTTTQQPTAVSGRGLGLNIVKKTIESLGGAITVSSEPRQGTTFTLEIPLALAVIKTLFVEVGGTQYAIPLANIERLVTVTDTQIKGFLEHEAIVLNGTDIPITRLHDLFDVPRRALEQQPIVIVRKGEELLGLGVDRLLTTQEVVIKPLSRLVRETRYVAGSTIVGSGEVVLILDVTNLILSKRQTVLATAGAGQ